MSQNESQVLPNKERYERVRHLCAIIVRAVLEDEVETDLVDLWVSYRLLTLQIEKDLSENVDALVKQAYHSEKKEVQKVAEAAKR